MRSLDGILGPELPGAACVGLAPEFDLTIEGERADAREARHAGAIAVCQGCPVLDACAASLPTRPPAAGVWAGAIREPRVGGSTLAALRPRAAGRTVDARPREKLGPAALRRREGRGCTSHVRAV